jgi:hypothetical protein
MAELNAKQGHFLGDRRLCCPRDISATRAEHSRPWDVFSNDPKSRASASSATLAHRFVEEVRNSFTVQTSIGCSLPASLLSRDSTDFVVIGAAVSVDKSDSYSV